MSAGRQGSRGARGRALLTALLPALLVAGLGTSGVASTAYGSQERPRRVFTIRSPQIVESSSLAVSTVDPSLVYTTNDSGDHGTVYTLDAATGAVVGRTTLTGADPLDVEAITAVSDGSLVVADIGDNNADHSTADLYLIDQPGRGNAAVTPDRVDLTYVGGPRDAESVLYDVDTGRAFVVSKVLGGAKVYGTPPHVFDHQRAWLRPLADAPTIATDATFLPGRKFAVIRTYSDATVYAYPSWEKVVTFDLPSEQQGESITAPPSGDVVWVGSEGARSRVLEVPLPALPGTASSSGSADTPSGVTSSPGASSGSAGEHQADTGSGTSNGADSSAQHLAQVVFVISSAALLAILVGLVLVALSRRRTPS